MIIFIWISSSTAEIHLVLVLNPVWELRICNIGYSLHMCLNFNQGQFSISGIPRPKHLFGLIEALLLLEGHIIIVAGHFSLHQNFFAFNIYIIHRNYVLWISSWSVRAYNLQLMMLFSVKVSRSGGLLLQIPDKIMVSPFKWISGLH